MKKIFLLAVMAMFISGCVSLKMISGINNLKIGDYDSAIDKCKEAFNDNLNNDKPVMKKVGNFEYDMIGFYSSMCIAAAYMGKHDYDNAKKYWLKNIEYFPPMGYIAYSSLATMSYLAGNLNEAYRYSLLGKELVDSDEYDIVNSGSNYGINVWRDGLRSAWQYYDMRIKYNNMLTEYEKGNYKKAITIGNDILNQQYLIHSGMRIVSGNTINTVENGSIEELNGILPGDKLIKVDDFEFKDVNDAANTTELNEKITKSYGTVITGTIERKGRLIPLTIRMVYPEVEATKNLIEQARNALSSPKGKKKVAGPWIKVLEPKTARGVKIAGNTQAQFRILASDIDLLRSVSVNGITCSEHEPSLLESTMLPGNVKRYTISLPLVEGENKFDITAVNNKGTKAYQHVTINGSQAFIKELDQVYKHRVAVVIGINKYYPWPSLEFAVNDARSVKDKLHKIGYDKVIELYDTEATRAMIMRILMDDLPIMLGPDDCLFVFFAGHGATEDLSDGGKEGYIMPVDADVANYRGTGISMSSIHEMIKKYRAKHIMFVFDSCYSGLGLKRSGGIQVKKIDGFIKSMAQKPVSLILTAGGKDEQASEEKGHGVFTKAFLDAIDGKNGLAQDGYILASDIAQEVRKKVHNKSNGKQVPQFGILTGEGDFIFESY